MTKITTKAKSKSKSKSKSESKSRPAASAGLRRQLEQKNRELNEALEQQAATADVLKTISGSTFDLAAVLETLVRSAAKLCRADRAAIRLLKDGALHHLASYGFTAQQRDFMIKTPVPAKPHRGSIGGRVLVEGRIVQIADSKADPDFRLTVRPAFADVRTVLGAPLLRGDALIGLLILSRKAVEPFTDKQIELVTTFADQAVIAIENARLLNELRRRTADLSEALEQQTATSEVLQVISSSPGALEPVFTSILDNATRICGANFGTLFLREGEALRVAAHHGSLTKAWDEQWRVGMLLQRDAELQAFQTLSTRRPLQVVDLSQAPSYLARNPRAVNSVEIGGIRTMVTVPMLKDGEAIGVISIFRTEIREFTDKQITLVTNFADQAVIAIENARLLNELRQRTDDLTESLEQQTATSEVLKVISSSPGELQPVFDAILENVTRICDAPFAGLFRLDGGAARLVAQRGLPPRFAEFLRREGHRPGPNHPFTRMVRTKQTVLVPEYLTDEAYLARDPMAVGGVEIGGIRTLLAVPMLKDDELVGFIGTFRQVPMPFTEKQIALVTNFAAQAVIAIENTRLLSELRQSLEQQTATADVLRVISASPGDLEPVFHAMLENAVRICEARFGVLFRFDGEKLHFAAEVGTPAEYVEFQRRRGPFLPRPGTQLERVVRTRQISHTADDTAESVPGMGAELGGARSLATVPMLKDDALVGAFVIFRQEVRPFTEKQIALLESFAAQAVIAIENTRLLNELRQSLEQQTATADVLRVISSSPGELDPVFGAMLENATRICEAKFGTLALCEGDALRAVALHGGREGYADERRRNPVFRPAPNVPVMRALRMKQVQHVADMLTEQAYIDRDAAIVTMVETGGARTFLAVPMLKDNEAVGVIIVYRQEVRPFTEKQIALVQNFAAQAVIAIENTRLLNELRQSLEQQTATADVLRVISSSPGDLEPVFRVMLENATRICQATFGVLSLREDAALRVVAMHNAPPAYAELRRREPTWMLTGPMGRLAAQAVAIRQSVQVPDLAAYGNDDPLIRDFSTTTGARSMILVPLLKDGELIGTSAIYRQEVRPFTDKQVELLTNFAAQAVIAIENARLLNELRQRTDDLSKSLENLRAAQDRLVQTEKLASLGQLTAGIAHEIKNPLNFVNNFSSLSVELIDELQEELGKIKVDVAARSAITDLAETLKGNLDKIAQHGKRADAIVKNMLLHSREGSGERRPVDVNALVEESLNLAYHGARAETQGFNVVLERSFDADAGEADLYPQEVTRVLLNIIANGFYAAHKRKSQADGADFEPTIVASTKNLGDRVEIRIRDNGTGIPPEVKERMFNPFFTTKPAGEGTGLGLSISHDIIVKQHAGTIAVDTKPGQFTEFAIVLPRRAAPLGKRAETA